MLTVLPHADELAKGHLGRWSLINGCSGNDSCMKVMRRKFEQSGSGPRTTPFLHVLACFSGIDARSYERLHSMLPFMSFAVKENLRTSDGGWAPAVVRGGLLTPRKLAYFCPACVSEDRRYWGYSYWRRSHQLPSSFWCDKHPTERLHAAITDLPFDRLPDHWLEVKKSEPQTLPEDIRDHAVLRRFEEACQSMLDAGSSRHVKSVRRVLCNQAHQRGLATGCDHFGPTKRVRLSDMARKTLPVDLLQVLFPGVLGKASGAFHTEIDEAVRSGGLTSLATGTALALSLLYPSVSEAFMEMDEVCKRPQLKTLKSTIEELFVKQNGNVSVIAKDMNLSIAAATEIIISHRHAIYRAIDQNLESLALKDFHEGESLPLQDICERHGANHKLVERALWLQCAAKFKRNKK